MLSHKNNKEKNRRVVFYYSNSVVISYVLCFLYIKNEKNYESVFRNALEAFNFFPTVWPLAHNNLENTFGTNHEKTSVFVVVVIRGAAKLWFTLIAEQNAGV